MKPTIIAVIIAMAFITGALLLSGRSGADGAPSEDNVSMVDGQQVIEITAKGGYLPKKTLAKAGVPTVLQINTKGTFDCSSAISIPSLGYRKNLPPSAQTLIDIPIQESGATLTGICAMGMYSFTVQFN